MTALWHRIVVAGLWRRIRNGPLITLDNWQYRHSAYQAHQRADRLAAQLFGLRVTMEAVQAVIARAYEDDGLPVPEAFQLGERKEVPGPCPEPGPVTQRDLDDAVAELIRRARQESGGAR